MHLTSGEILEKLLSCSQELREHYKLYQLLLFHFQEKKTEHFFGLIENTISCVNPIFQTVFKTFLKDKDKILNALELPYSNAKLEATNNLIKVIKRNAFGFRNFDNFKTRILIALNIKKERTFWEPTTVDKEPRKPPELIIQVVNEIMEVYSLLSFVLIHYTAFSVQESA